MLDIKSKIIHFSLEAKKSENNETVISKPINSKAEKKWYRIYSYNAEYLSPLLIVVLSYKMSYKLHSISLTYVVAKGAKNIMKL